MLKILELKADWEQISEVYYWLAQVSFLQKKFSQGIEFLKTIDKEKISQEENFNLFESKIENDNFLKYEEEYGTYKETIDINVDNDIIDFDETIE